MEASHEAVLRRTQQTWHCLWGHTQYFPQGETEETKLRRERDRLKQNEARLEQRITALREQRDAETRKVSAAKGRITKLKKRAATGTCPCCNRHFTNLQRHMETKHAGFLVEDVQSAEGQTVQ